MNAVFSGVRTSCWILLPQWRDQDDRRRESICEYLSRRLVSPKPGVGGSPSRRRRIREIRGQRKSTPRWPANHANQREWFEQEDAEGAEKESPRMDLSVQFEKSVEKILDSPEFARESREWSRMRERKSGRLDRTSCFVSAVSCKTVWVWPQRGAKIE
jgi:DNA primase catalytic subunit